VFTEATLTASQSLTERMANPFYAIQWLYDLTPRGRVHTAAVGVLHDFSRRAIREREAALAAGAPPRDKFFIDVLLAATDTDGKQLTFDEVNAEVDTFLFEGHDTTSSGLMWTLYCLATHQSVQDRCATEARAAMARHGGTAARLKADDVPLLTAAVRESHRLYPPVPGYGRKLKVDTALPSRPGEVLPAGSQVIVLPLLMHRLEAVWGDSVLDFDPSRFARGGAMDKGGSVAKADGPAAAEAPQDATAGVDPFAYVPFSAGPRGCIGKNFALLEERVVLTKILSEFRISLAEGTVPKPVIEMVLRNEGPMNLRLERREA
jgi:cytochrome P450